MRIGRLVEEADVVFGSIASVWLRAGHFRSSTNNGHHQTALVCLKGCQERDAARIRQLTAALEAWTSILRFGGDLFRQMRPRFALASETIRTLMGLNLPGELAVKRILKPVTYVLAALYFLVDAAFMAVAKPIADWLARHVVLGGLGAWIRSFGPYPSLAVFSVPVIILEPVKPVAAYLAATGQMVSSVVTLVVGEILKLVLVERLFSLTRDKLLKIPAFAWAYGKLQQAKAWLKATEAWRAVQSVSRAARNYVAQLKSSTSAFRHSKSA